MAKQQVHLKNYKKKLSLSEEKGDITKLSSQTHISPVCRGAFLHLRKQT